MIFLIGYSIFNFGRPLQLLLGPYPLPLIIVNIRVFILCTVISPSIILAAISFKNREKLLKKDEIAITLVSLILGVTYVVFNTLGTQDSYIMLDTLNLTIYDNFTPSLSKPFYGREITITVQIIIGVILTIFSISMLVKLKFEITWNKFVNHKIFYINVAILVFALSFIYGSIAKQWWIYYAASIISTLSFGWSVLQDIKEVYDDYDKLIPFIKEDILNNVVFNKSSKDKLKKMLFCLKKCEDPDTFLIIDSKSKKDELNLDPYQIDQIQKILKLELGNFFVTEDYLIFPLTSNEIGVVIRLLNNSGEKNPLFLDHLDSISKEISKKIENDINIGVGNSYSGLEYMYQSFSEAQNALAIAKSIDGNQVIHIENIMDVKSSVNHYPVREKINFLNYIKVGDITNVTKELNIFLNLFEEFINRRPDSLQVRLYELVGSLIDTAIIAGGDEDKLNNLAIKYFKEVENICNRDNLRSWLTTTTIEITSIVSNVYESRSKVLVNKALDFMCNNIMNASLGYKDVAKEIFISPSYFLSLFKQETGTTFVEKLNNLRLKMAKELLLNSNKSITEISFDVGFNNSNYFSSKFSKTVGVSAMEYRKQCQGNN
ncbi:MAG: helix-turn-helix transcriptional regulator [Spirochaetaceae bacterium]